MIIFNKLLTKDMKDLKLNSLITVLILCIIILGVIIFRILNKESTQTVISQTKGSIVVDQSAGELGGDFLLTDQDGKPFSSNTLKGKYSLIYFGFARCPDICPAILSKLDEVVKILKRQGKPAIEIVFISLDPERDTPIVLADYLKNFDNNIIGLSGSTEAVQQVSEAFKVFHHKIATELYLKAAGISQASPPNQDDYLINHTSLVYLMDPQFHYLTSFHFDSTAEEIVNYLNKLEN